MMLSDVRWVLIASILVLWAGFTLPVGAVPFEIVATAGDGGAISPKGPVDLPYGGNISFNITADSGFSVAEVLVDEDSVGAVSSYTFPNVTANHTIHAAFQQGGPVFFQHDLGDGWNLFSTPILLMPGHDTLGTIFSPDEQQQIEIFYVWTGSIWNIVGYDYQLLPLNVVYTKVDGGATALIHPSTAVSGLPTRPMPQGVSVIGPALAYNATSEGFDTMSLEQALASIREAPNGLTGYSIVVSPGLNQPGWVYALGGSTQSIQPFRGYWVVMENSDLNPGLVGFSTTPVSAAQGGEEVILLEAGDAEGVDQILDLDDNTNAVFGAARGLMVDGTELFVVRSFSGLNGSLCWTARYDQGAGENAATAVTANDNLVVAGGYGDTSGGDQLLLVRAYDPDSGSFRWNYTYDRGGGSNEVHAMASGDGLVVAAGSGRDAAGDDAFLVLAFDPDTGALLWQDAFEGGGGENGAMAVTVSDDGVFVAGYDETAAGDREFVVRGYDPASGAVLWTDRFDHGGYWDGAVAIADMDGMVFSAGVGADEDENANLIVRAYDATSGDLVWEDIRGDGSAASTLDAFGGQVFVSGVEAGPRFVVRAYDADTGDLQWSDAIEKDGGFNFDTAVDREAGMVTFSGFSQSFTPELDYTWNVTVRSYNPLTGELIAETERNGIDGRSAGTDMIIHEGLSDPVFVSLGLEPEEEGGQLLTATTAGTPHVQVEGRKILIDGSQVFLKGVDYAPTPIGGNPAYVPFGDWFQDYWISIPQRDVPIMRDMHVNCIRLYGQTAFRWDDPQRNLISHEKFYRLLQQNGISVFGTVYTTTDNILTFDPDNWQNNIWMLQWMALIKEGNQYPAVIGWTVGNELNPENLRSSPSYWTKYNQVIGLVKGASPDRVTLTAVVDDSMITPAFADQYLTNLDVWGINSFRGRIGTLANPFDPPASAFDSLFLTFSNASAKPLIITEWGPSASTRDGSSTVLLPENAKAVADYLEVHWNRSPSTYPGWGSDDITHSQGVCSGAVVFYWSDGWEKVAPVWQHDPNNDPKPEYPGGWDDQEWYGINGVAVNNRNPMNPDPGKPDLLSARAAYGRLQALWAT